MIKNLLPMSWNEPGGKKPDPWGGGGRDAPPDLDQIFSKLQQKLRNMLGGGGGGAAGGGFGKAGKGFGVLPIIIAVALVVLYLASGIYIVKPAEQAVVTRLGKYNRMVGPGPHWYPRFLEEQRIINTEKILSTRHVGTMLTKDENLVTLEIEVQYQVNDINKYLFKVDDPDRSLRQASESALRQVVGMNSLDYIITAGRGEIENQTEEQLKQILDSYDAGLRIEAVNLKDAKAPNQVKAAFDDATKAREDRERFVHEAEAYYNQIVPEAKGAAQQIIEQAEAYKQEVINNAHGDTEKFRLVLPEFEKAPKVTKTRLYIDTIEKVLSNSSKVLVDLGGAGNNNLVYLPLDRLFNKGADIPTNSIVKEQQTKPNYVNSPTTAEADNMRDRDRDLSRRG